MKKLFLILLLFSAQLYAAEEHEKNYVPLGCDQLVDISTAMTLPNIPEGAAYAIWQATGAEFWWRDDGTTIVAGSAMEQAVGGEFKYFYNGVLGKVQIIEQSTSTVFDICYYK